MGCCEQISTTALIKVARSLWLRSQALSGSGPPFLSSFSLIGPVLFTPLLTLFLERGGLPLLVSGVNRPAVTDIQLVHLPTPRGLDFKRSVTQLLRQVDINTHSAINNVIVGLRVNGP